MLAVADGERHVPTWPGHGTQFLVKHRSPCCRGGVFRVINIQTTTLLGAGLPKEGGILSPDCIWASTSTPLGIHPAGLSYNLDSLVLTAA